MHWPSWLYLINFKYSLARALPHVNIHEQNIFFVSDSDPFCNFILSLDKLHNFTLKYRFTR